MTPEEWEYVPPARNPRAAMLRILARADAIAAARHWPGYSRIALMMDIEFVNADIPLDIVGLANAGASDFIHDVLGIWNNYNRVTGRMDNLFMPRCARLERSS